MSILGPDATPGTPEFDLYIKEVVNEMTAKAGQKCTAIRRIIAPSEIAGDVVKALSPILGSIPLLGVLFRNRSVDKVKTNLMVFIRPTILRDGTEATNATHAKYNYARDLLMEGGTNVPQMIGEDRPTIPTLESFEEQKKALDSATDDSGD
jgi:hypothetical protein